MNQETRKKIVRLKVATEKQRCQEILN